MPSTKKPALLYLVSALSTGSVALSAQANESDIIVNIGDDLISISAEKKKLSDILIRLGVQLGIEVTGADNIDVMFDGDVSGKDVEDLLRLLGVNSILVWNDSSDTRKLDEIILLSVSDEGSIFLPAGDSDEISSDSGGVATQQFQSESDVSSQSGESSVKPAVGVDNDRASTEIGSETSPGFGFSIDPNSATINPQQ